MLLKKKDSIIQYFVYVIMYVIFSLLSYYELANTPDILNMLRILLICLIVSGFVGICFIIFYLFKKNITFEKKFLIIGLFIGIIYLIGIPMMKGTDETPHFLRTYQISSGNIVVNEDNLQMIPENIYKYATPLDLSFYQTSTIFEKVSKELVEVGLSLAPVTYPPTQYVPQVFGCILAKILHLGPFMMFYLIRLSNLLSFLFISYLALKKLPIKKEFTTILYLSPAMLSLVATMSGDAFLNSCILLFISIIIDIVYNKKKVCNKDGILLFILSIIIASIKIVYIPILLLLFLIKKEQFSELEIKKNKLSKNKYIISVLIISFLLVFIWNTVSAIETTSLLPGQQLNFILSNPFEYLMIFISTFTNDAFYYISNLVVGSEMCLREANINSLLVLYYVALFIISYFYDNKKLKLDNKTKIIIWIMFLLILGAVSTVMYLNWTVIYGGVEFPEIVGVQSRYFMTLIPILALTLPVCKNKLKNTDILMNSCLVLNVLIGIDAIASLVIKYSSLL